MNDERLITAYHEACHAIFVLINEENCCVFKEIKDEVTSYSAIYENKGKLSLAEFAREIKIDLAGKIGSLFFLKDEFKMNVQNNNEALVDFKNILKIYQLVKNDFEYEVTAENIAFLQKFVPEIIQTMDCYQKEIILLVQCYLLNDNLVTREQALYIMKNRVLPSDLVVDKCQFREINQILKQVQCEQVIVKEELFKIADIFKVEIEEINTKLRCKANEKEQHKKLLKMIIIDDDIDVVQNFLQKNKVDCNIKNENGDPLLLLAIENGQKAVVTELLKYGADINIGNKAGMTALDIAVTNSFIEIVDLLLVHEKITVNLGSKDGYTSLHLAAFTGHLEVVKLLLTYEKDVVNVEAKHGYTSLHLSALKGCYEVVTLLLEYGAKVLDKSENGETALHLAASKGHYDIVELLLNRGAKVWDKSENGETALHLAAYNGHYKVVELLLKKGAKVLDKNKNTKTSLHYAALKGHYDIVATLLKYEKNAVNGEMENGFTPLHLAASNGHYEISELLLEHNANSRVKSKKGETPLHLAALNGHSEIVKLLLTYEKDIKYNQQNIINCFKICAENKFVIKKEISLLLKESLQKLETILLAKQVYHVEKKAVVGNSANDTLVKKIEPKQPPTSTEMNWNLFEANDNIPPTLPTHTNTTFDERKTRIAFSEELIDKKPFFSEQINSLETEQKGENRIWCTVKNIVVFK